MSDVLRVSNFFDRVYREHDRYWWRDQDRYAIHPDDYPQSLLTQQTLRVLQGRSGGWALDLGAGEGTDAIRLALLGYRVDAVEMSAVGARKIKYFADRENAEVNVITADIQAFIPDKPYDVIICNGALHYIEDKDSVISLMQNATRRGGINVISLWSTYTPVPECHEIIPVYCDDEDGVVTNYYKAWIKEFIYFERGKADTAHDDLPDHQHSHIKLIARKPLDY